MDIKIPDELALELEAISEGSGQTTESLIVEMLTEAIKMRVAPGIVFADGATGRRARVGGSGIQVFEVIDVYELMGRDRSRVAQNLPELAPHLIDAAIRYYESYPGDVLLRLKTDEQVQTELETLWAAMPETSPNWYARRPEQTDPQAGSHSRSSIG